MHLCLGLLSLSAVLLSHSVALAVTKPTSRASVVPLDVTVNGVSRPDVGKALSDAFSAAMLKRGDYRIFSTESVKPSRPVKAKKGDVLLGTVGPASSQKALPASSQPEVDYWFTFNLVGQDSRFSLTVKKIDAKTQEVMGAQELATTGQLERVMALVPQALDKLDTKKRVLPFPMSQSPSEVRAAMPAPVVVRSAIPQSAPAPAPRRSPGTYMGVPPEFADIDLTHVPKALVYRRVGSIEATNQPWKFAIVKPMDGKGLGVSDTVQVLWDDTSKTYSSLRVANWDTGRVIADFGHNPSHHPLFVGDAVYGWAEPLW
jgi:hypothetical protein